ncbi:MAG: acyl-CoA/acyl-ACP dehydrogenase [Chloroflexi bacterium]|nr:acyl-CoA/acyl-ACP dehydrogenase [Chloroflexota bacterium]
MTTVPRTSTASHSPETETSTLPTGGEHDVVGLAERLAGEFRGRAAEFDRSAAFPFDHYRRMRETGYLKAGVPTELGGFGAGLATLAQAQQALARGCASTALAVNMHVYQVGAVADGWRTGAPVEATLRRVANDGIVLASTASEAVTPGEWRSDTIARRDGDGYRLNGRKAFCSQAPGMSVFRLIATDADSGDSLLISVPASAEGLRVVETWDTMGMRATASHDIALENVWVPDAMMGGIIPPKPLEHAAFTRSVIWFHCLLSSVYLGLAEEARAEAYRVLASEKRGTGRERSLTDVMIGELEADLLVATATRDRVVNALDQDRSDLQASLRQTILCKQIVTDKAMAIVNRAVELCGGRAYFRTSSLERLSRDVMAARFHPPAAPVSYQMVGQRTRQGWSTSA